MYISFARSVALRTLVENHNESMAGSGTDMITAVSLGDARVGGVSFQFTPDTAGVLSATITVSSTATTHNLYGGATLTAGAMFPGEFMVPYGATVNFRYTGSSTGKYDLIVREI